MDIDYKKYYDLEGYLFGELGCKFTETGTLSVEDFFCIVIWKAERAKSTVAHRMKSQLRILDPKSEGSLGSAVDKLCRSIHSAKSDEERLQVLFNHWQFELPMATAVLAILYPDQFTVYDFRVCEMLIEDPDLAKLGNLSVFEKVWKGYQRYVEKVRAQAPHLDKLRDKDRWLWGKSFYLQLRSDAAKGFPTPKEREASEAARAC